jgi:SAM-dependent methyltransferase
VIELLWNAPISEATMAQCLESLDLAPGQRVLDVGCGSGDVLIRLAEQFSIEGTGIDSSDDAIAEANSRKNDRRLKGSIHFESADARNYFVAPESWDVVLCLGATHALGLGQDAYRNALVEMMPWLVPGGLLLIGEGYMKQPAAPEYRKLLGDSMPDEMTHAANLATGQDLGLKPLADWTSSGQEWDGFEWAYQRIVVLDAVNNPDDPAVMARLSRRNEWMDAYLRWGRDTLGYGMYLFQKPGTPC